MHKDKPAIPMLKQWRDEESRIPMMRGCDMEKLTGAPEYHCTVRTPTIAMDRFLCKVTLKGYDEPDILAWVDTTTGTLYGMDGACMSGPLRLHGNPSRTGRDVPGKNKRQYEGEQRAMIW